MLKPMLQHQHWWLVDKELRSISKALRKDEGSRVCFATTLQVLSQIMVGTHTKADEARAVDKFHASTKAGFAAIDKATEDQEVQREITRSLKFIDELKTAHCKVFVSVLASARQSITAAFEQKVTSEMEKKKIEAESVIARCSKLNVVKMISATKALSSQPEVKRSIEELENFLKCSTAVTSTADICVRIAKLNSTALASEEADQAPDAVKTMAVHYRELANAECADLEDLMPRFRATYSIEGHVKPMALEEAKEEERNKKHEIKERKKCRQTARNTITKINKGMLFILFFLSFVLSFVL